ncbi:NUDIX hydrolase domain-like protein [Lasiosphaeria miniovina]|uniref:NUDIX hydrolase domain-like protein n=1 Tax=Lasiosphaeria miniovina TaxID=1954250 RepID=A0AA40BFJ3_9PEZI|nr:NUDIX hydrolase domain-like protein [Lasiosphaeria miniovina]KAK0733013.1 NUDIX hydrolase domain-like protein [Lasiosphaeria miniovina]
MAAPSQVIGLKQPQVKYVDRFVVRVVAFNSAGEVAIIHAKRDNYYKFPGGGIDPDEEHETAVHQEMKEETGCLIKLRQGGCVTITEEYRSDLHQLSHCYSADLVDDSGAPALTEDEAKRAMAATEPTTELSRFIKERDMFLLDVGIALCLLF